MDPRVDRAMNLLRRNSLIYIHSQPRPTNAISEKWAVCAISGHDNSDVDKESMVRPTYARIPTVPLSLGSRPAST